MNGISEILGAFGISTDIAQALFQAESDPTSENIQKVVDAYASHGMVVPGQVMAQLLAANERQYPNDTYASRGIGWLVAGAAALALFLRGRR